MATLYVENVPDDLYTALRKRARERRSSISREVIEVLKETVPTAAELKRREELFRRALRMTRMKPLAPGPFPTAEEMVREDRAR
jgi:plasmid stability protein